MKKIIFLILFCLSATIASSQITSQITSKSLFKSYQKITSNDTVLVIFFNGIISTTDITYSGTGTTINWYKYSNLTTPYSSGTNEIFNPDNATGYILDVDGKRTAIWVIDYKNYLPNSNAISIKDIQSDPCKSVSLNINVPQLSYKTLSNINNLIPLPRDFTIKYQTYSWDAKTSSLAIIDTTQTLTTPTTQKTVPVPYTNTVFTLTGDQYATDLGISPISVSSSLYVTQAVISHPTSVVTTRDAKNEAVRPSQASPINFSAPIDVQFLSNSNIPVPVSYRWEIFKNPSTSPLISRSEKDTRYTFTEFGTYNVKVTVRSNTCTSSDSIIVSVSESAIYVPNVFTPNGDGFNDEFRVAYKSLISFQCWVYNRWGRQVYYWTDPTKGWDGNINGKKAVPGPYFYVIKATGSDKKVYKLRGDINLLRGAGN